MSDVNTALDRLHTKYEGLRRTSDGSEVEGWYFVLRPYSPENGSFDGAAIAAMEAYAGACEEYLPELAADLRRQAEGFRTEMRWQEHYMREWER